MGFVVLDPLKANRIAVLIDDDLDFRHVEIECAVLESFSTQQGGQCPRRVQTLAQPIARWVCQEPIRFFVSQSFCAADKGSRKTGAAGSARLIELQKDR